MAKKKTEVKLTRSSSKALRNFDRSSLDWGWKQDQGVGDAVGKSERRYNRHLAELKARIAELESLAATICMDCGVNTVGHPEGHHYMLRNSIWHAIVEPDNRHCMLCLDCAEARIGRPLNRSDFAQVPLNIVEPGTSPALSLRLSRVENGDMQPLDA